jgi:glycosyltransferase involved in cell wall biosynthesis
MPPLIDDLLRNGVTLPIVMRITAPDYHDPDKAVTRANAIIASGTSIAMLRKELRPDAHNVPNGVDTEHFKPQQSSFRKEQGIPDDDLVVLFVARFHLVKNHAMLVEAFALLLQQKPCSRLVLVGAGPLEQSVKGRCAELNVGDRVHFLGEVAYTDVPAVYAAADINVISSDYESFSFAALEGMATGLPLVVTDTEWVPSLIEQTEGGIVVPKNDASAFAHALGELAEDPDRRKRLGAWNQARVLKQYRWQNSAQKLHSIYKSLISKSHHE